MELTNEHKETHSQEGKKPSVIEKTDSSTPVKPIIVDDVELNEDQLNIISGGGDLTLLGLGGKP